MLCDEMLHWDVFGLDFAISYSKKTGGGGGGLRRILQTGVSQQLFRRFRWTVQVIRMLQAAGRGQQSFLVATRLKESR